MDIQLSAGGRVLMAAHQQVWHGDTVMQTCRFAGQEMIAVLHDERGILLWFLGFEKVFRSMDDAKAAAPEFARQVLSRMAEMIAD